ncbi:hypothetical protein, partial [Limnospira sp. PMC 917.15]|uniref:hypothetical protein n=1 Tax=Limnospira sp. PMC 917.15 TaxID=2981106 RepID=UPI0028E164B9
LSVGGGGFIKIPVGKFHWRQNPPLHYRWVGAGLVKFRWGSFIDGRTRPYIIGGWGRVYQNSGGEVSLAAEPAPTLSVGGGGFS